MTAFNPLFSTWLPLNVFIHLCNHTNIHTAFYNKACYGKVRGSKRSQAVLLRFLCLSYLYLHVVVKDVRGRRFTRCAGSLVSLKLLPTVSRRLETAEAESEDLFEDAGSSQGVSIWASSLSTGAMLRKECEGQRRRQGD